ncbi:ATP-binding cassette domain-containing protein [Bacillus mangrovi]|uniref:ATP-binding cassette domain-containing protein n=1 Tax=Metabacillus mangrovi TaxID=1491830 RepID=A0A7X2V6T6_9BACI|nr:ABC transporter ATP-binding protein [Metabacillus mangrovi]MTH55725.1 ATP-binding cassette domain-containing protein [Metabacillus mangrovi]
MSYILEVQGLKKKIGKRYIVNDVNFRVEAGEIFGLLGPNGAGKTTIIRMITGLINKTEGNVLIKGSSADTNFKESMNELGAIVENPEFYKFMTGYANLKHYARMSVKPITEERIKEVIRLVKLENAIHQKVKTYSLGMRQRLGVAQALLHEPSLLILDEPTNGLDPQGMKELRDYLKELAKSGTSILVSSHMLGEMQLMCDRFAIIEKGELTHVASMEDTDREAAEELREVKLVVSSAAEASVLPVIASAENLRVADEQTLTFMAKYDSMPEIIKQLAGSGILVYELTPAKKSLEDRFLELTRQKEEAVL